MVTKTIKTEIKEGRAGYYSLTVESARGELYRYDELTRDRQWLEALAARIAEGELSLLHILDVLEDSLP